MTSRRARSALLVVLVLLVAACHPPATIVTQQGKAAYTADQIVIRVNELQNAAIAANGQTPPALDTATTRKIVTWCVQADKTLAAAPSGWQATVTQGWTALKADLPPTVTANVAIAAAFNAVDVALATLGGTQ